MFHLIKNKKIFFLFGLGVFGLTLNLYAEDTCDMKAVNMGNQSAMNKCATIDYKKAENLLNKTYDKLLNLHKHNKHFIENLKKSQMTWIKFRDAEVNMLMTYSDMPGNYGTMNSMLRSGELQSLTEKRIKELQKYIKDGIMDQEEQY